VAHLTPDTLERARAVVALYPRKRSALVPVLHLLQEQDGYLTAEGIEEVAQLLGLTPAEVRGTASFYEMFHFGPVGKYLVAVCTNIACMLAGAYELLEHIEESLGTHPGATTEDGDFTLEEAECLALCGNPPCLTVNWRYFGDMTPERWDSLADDLRAGRLAGEVPPHGALCRVRRSVGLLAGGGRPSAKTSAASTKEGVPPPREAVPPVELTTARTTPAASSTVLRQQEAK
jgi:NADH-quinone oxidoreductase subunit E